MSFIGQKPTLELSARDGLMEFPSHTHALVRSLLRLRLSVTRTPLHGMHCCSTRSVAWPLAHDLLGTIDLAYELEFMVYYS